MREGLRLLGRCGFQQEGEFVATHASQRARWMDRGFSDDPAETGGGFDQSLIAGFVSQIVVQILKAIQVEQQHRQGFSRIVPGKCLLELTQEHRPVSQARKRVQQAVLTLGLRTRKLSLDARVHHRQVQGPDHIIVGALTQRVDDGVTVIDRTQHNDGKLTGRVGSTQ